MRTAEIWSAHSRIFPAKIRRRYHTVLMAITLNYFAASFLGTDFAVRQFLAEKIFWGGRIWVDRSGGGSKLGRKVCDATAAVRRDGMEGRMTETVQIELREDQRVMAVQWMLDYAAAVAPTGVGVTPIASVIEGAEALARYVASGEQPVRPAEGDR